jgi:hypothetical protein
MKPDKYNPIKHEVVDKKKHTLELKFLMKLLQTCTKIYFKKKFNTAEVCHVCAKEFWGRMSLLQHLKIHEGIEHKCEKCSYKCPSK